MEGLEMTEQQAEAVAEILEGQTWQSGGGVWLVLCRRADGHLVVISDDVVCEYENEGAFEQAKPCKSIVLA
jgi:hypothetical protein